MGLKDHLEDETGHILSLGLDLDYLHVEGADRQAGLSATVGAAARPLGAAGARGVHGSTSTSISSSPSPSISNYSEESTGYDSDDERVQNCSDSDTQNPHLPGPGQNPHLPGPGQNPHLPGPGQNPHLPGPGQNPHPPDPAQTRISGEFPPSTAPFIHSQNKMEFALKLGYSEELVLLVLGKLGPGALINDILGELVKLGARTELQQEAVSQFPSSSSSFSSSSSAHSSSSSSSSLDSCRLVCPSPLLEKENLRPVVLDGSNVAMSHGNKEVFSCHGIQLAVDWFLDRGHTDITVFVPAWRKEQSRPDALITDQEILRRLEREKILVFTPSRRVQGRRVVCYDDRFIVKLAHESDGIIVSNDNYRDLANEKPEWKKFIDERLLMYSFVNDKFMPPDDPLGRHGPSLENFLRIRPVIREHRKQPCPYGKKCTYGHKCKFYHPERGTQPQLSVADGLRASAKASSSSSKAQGDAAMARTYPAPPGSRPDLLADPRSAPPQRQLDSSLRTALLEDPFEIRPGSEARRGSCSSSFLAPAGPPIGRGCQQDRRDPQGGGGGSRAVGASGVGPGESYPWCESPDLGSPSLVRAYSSLSLGLPQSPERFFPADLQTTSLPSDCSSEGSLSSQSLSPELLLDNSHKCPHHHHHRHHPCSGQYSQPPSHSPASLPPHPHHGYPLPMGPGRLHSYGMEDPPSSLLHFKSPLAYLPSHLQPRPGCPGDYPHPPPRTSSPHARSQGSPLGRTLLGSAWQDNCLPESRLFERYPLTPRRGYPGQEPHIARWDPQYQPPPQPSYEPFSFQNLPEGLPQPWHSPWTRGTLSPHRPQPSFPPVPSSLPTLPSLATQLQEPPEHGRYREMREKVFANLINIFPVELVRLVMGRNPHVSDAQELAAAILVEKIQHGY